jgi:hypothetical protein
MRKILMLALFLVPFAAQAEDGSGFVVEVCQAGVCESLDLNVAICRLEGARQAAIEAAIDPGSTKDDLGGNRCWICPETQEPPPDPSVPGDFCTGKRHEYRYYDNDALGGVLAAYNFCIDQGSYSVLCRKPDGQPGQYLNVHTWMPYQGECAQFCSPCE